MNYVHVKNLEKYHPGYKDRTLAWCKVFFTVIAGDPDWDLIDEEIDKWRLISLIILELKAKKPLPDNDKFWSKYFDIQKRPMSLTLQMLHNFIGVVTEETISCVLEKIREDKIIDCNATKLTKPNLPIINAVIEDLNNVCLTSYKPTSKKTGKHISARIRDGFTIEDFKKVHRTKNAEWRGTDMEKFLRPETLYGNKFESYLNQKEKSVKRYV